MPDSVIASASGLAVAGRLPSQEKTVLVIDLVESVRLMQADEAGTVGRWLGFMQRVHDELLPQHQGTMVKSLGDGLMASFDQPANAVTAALALHQLVQQFNAGQAAGRCMWLRAGLHLTHVYASKHDIYGAGVNLAARLAALAGPGETVVSATLRDRLVDGLDVAVEDLGDCFVKHVEGPTRAFRVGPAGAQPVLRARRDYTAHLQATIAVVPFESRNRDVSGTAVGDLIADGVIVRLSQSRNLRVISRLTTTVFRDRKATAAELAEHLATTYVLTGSSVLHDQQVLLSWELCDATTREVIKADRLAGQLADLFQLESELINCIVDSVHGAIFLREVQRVQSQPMPTLQSYALMLGAITLLHRSAGRDFAASFDVLSHLAHNHPLAAEPRAWLAKWYCLRAVQGLSTDRQADLAAALACTQRALATDPHNAFALAMQGFVHIHLSRDYATAMACLQQSLQINPSETFGRLFAGTVHGLQGNFEAGIESFEQARASSPLDPGMYLFDSIGASLYLGGGQHDAAMHLAQRSLRLNREHAHSWRILTIAQVEAGDLASARASLKQLLRVQPGLTAQNYLGAAHANDTTRRRFADALCAAGLPGS